MLPEEEIIVVSEQKTVESSPLDVKQSIPEKNIIESPELSAGLFKGYEDVPPELLKLVVELEKTSHQEFTPLHVAVKLNNVDLCALLLKRGANIGARAKHGLALLHIAAHYNHCEVAQYILSQGASPNVAASNGYRPLHILEE